MHPSIVILDFGSQYTQLIARRIRALEVHSVILPPSTPIAEIEKYAPLGIILSGGPASVYEKKSPKPAPGVLDSKVPILGICYGMQALMHLSGGKIEASDEREYGFAKLDILAPSALLEGVSPGSQVWMSHADKVTVLAPGYKEIAKSDFALAAIENAAARRYAVQFHPEVVHSLEGTKIISNFIFKIC
ncbi:MAG: glutamine-hydrolyzing GMP synthase, partial [Spirochaetia bacterium]|nr:glutamine-hydrolyzing GMP synthase [Spirochaetia bacterium]